MNNSSDKKGRKIASYLIPGIITLLVMIFVLIVKGISVSYTHLTLPTT